MDEDMLNDDERAVLELARGDTEVLQGGARAEHTKKFLTCQT